MEKFNFDVVSQTLTISAKFAKAMNNPESGEYNLAAKLKVDFPGLTISKRTHRTASHYTTKSGERFNCNQFKNLTYARMERFISALPNSEEYQREFEFMRDYAAAVQHNGYSLVREWFVRQFPEFRKNPLFYLNNAPVLLPGTTVIADTEAKMDKAG
jgi:hypothetical protein